MHRFRYVIVSLLALIPTLAHAAPISYFESISGDLSAADPLTNFTLDLGLNTIVGSIAAGTADFDSFAFTVPAGLEVLQAKVTLTDVTGNLGGASWKLYAGSDQFGSGTALGSFFAPSPGFADFPATPLGPDVYNVSAFSISNQGTSNYTFILDVHQIPEPASLALAALASLALVRRKR